MAAVAPRPTGLSITIHQAIEPVPGSGGAVGAWVTGGPMGPAGIVGGVVEDVVRGTVVAVVAGRLTGVVVDGGGAVVGGTVVVGRAVVGGDVVGTASVVVGSNCAAAGGVDEPPSNDGATARTTTAAAATANNRRALRAGDCTPAVYGASRPAGDQRGSAMASGVVVEVTGAGIGRAAGKLVDQVHGRFLGRQRVLENGILLGDHARFGVGDAAFGSGFEQLTDGVLRAAEHVGLLLHEAHLERFAPRLLVGRGAPRRDAEGLVAHGHVADVFGVTGQELLLGNFLRGGDAGIEDIRCGTRPGVCRHALGSTRCRRGACRPPLPWPVVLRSTASRAVAVAALAVIAMTALATPAGAHAQLKSTDPVSGQRFDDAPERVVLTFSEAVEVSFGAIAVYGEDGERLRLSGAVHPGGDRRAVAVDLPDLESGGYVVTWRVLSADSHPIRGAFTFRVGNATGDDRSADLARRLLAAEGGSTLVGAVFGVTRFVAFAGLVFLIGAIAFALVFWPPGRTDRRLRNLVTLAWVGTLAATALSIGLQGAYAGGLGLGDAMQPSVVGDVLDTRYGQVAVARLLLLALAVPLLRILLRGDRPVGVPVASMSTAIAVGLAATPGLAGHAGASENAALAVALDTVHIGAASVWIGGLAAMVVAALPAADAGSLASVVHDGATRFSRFAVFTVAAVVLTGSIQGWRQSQSVDAVTTTTYGRVLLVKIALVAVILIVAAASRRTVRQRQDRAGLRRLVGIEVAVAAGVIVASAVLVNLIPARSALALPVSTTITAGDVFVDITVDPAKAGPTDIHIYTLGRDGGTRDVEAVEAELDLQGRDLNPVDIPLQSAGPGHFAAYDFDVPIAGQWRLTVTVRTSAVDQARGSQTITFR